MSTSIELCCNGQGRKNKNNKNQTQNDTESASKSSCFTIHNKAYKDLFHSSEIPQEQYTQKHGTKESIKTPRFAFSIQPCQKDK